VPHKQSKSPNWTRRGRTGRAENRALNVVLTKLSAPKRKLKRKGVGMAADPQQVDFKKKEAGNVKMCDAIWNRTKKCAA